MSYGCTVFTATNKDITLVGNNEDMFHAKPKAEFHSPENGKYGRVFFGMGNNLHQGGMNEKGLFFDCVATGPTKKVLPKTKPVCPGGLMEKVLESCATIREAIELFDQYDSTYMNSYMTIVVDASGAAFVTQGGIIYKKEKSIFAVGRGEIIANQRLKEQSKITADLFRSIISDVHVEGVIKTLYSNVYDLNNQIIYLYYYYDFKNPLRIDLREYLKKGTYTYNLADLFPKREAQIKKNIYNVSKRQWKSAIKMNSATFAQYLGTYIGQGINIDVEMIDDKYQMRLLGTEAYELVPLSQTKFAVIDVSGSDSRIEFIKEKGDESFRLEADFDSWKFIADKVVDSDNTFTPKHIDQQILDSFEKDLEHLVKQNNLPGVAAGIIKDQKLVWAKGIGYADIENKVPASSKTLYRLASTSKPFAAVLIVQLIEQGKLSLDTSMAKFQVPPRYKKKPILVRHVLSHSSEWTPGEKFDYSGDAYSDLTLVIEETTKKSYPDILKASILAPAGMDRTLPGMLAPGYEKIMHNLAIPYEFVGGKLQRSAYPIIVCNWSALREQQWTIVGFLKTTDDFTRREILGDSYTPLYGGVNTSGGIVSNIVDLAKFDAALDRNELISEASRNLMFTPTLSNDKKVLPYGLGWFVQEIYKIKLVWHYGHFPPIASSLYLKIPEHNLTFLLLANTSQLSDSYALQEGDVVCSPYATLFLNHFLFKSEDTN
jgi:CubicO group peptidase (beta-lactamase class C family)